MGVGWTCLRLKPTALPTLFLPAGKMQTACCCVRCWNSKGGRYYLGCCYGNLTQEGAEQKYCHAGLPRRRRL
ncbi:hypothetical protein MRX96_038480 [Rhipicephalus microplus]